MTFPESPRLAFSRFTPELLLHLTSQEQRYLLLEKNGVDQLVMTPFTSEFASNTPEEFIERYVKGLNAQAWLLDLIIILEIAEQMFRT